MRRARRLGGLLATVFLLLGGCRDARPSLLDYLGPSARPPRTPDAADAAGLGREVALGERLLGGTVAQAAAPAPLAAVADPTGDAVERAREGASEQVRRALTIRQLLDVWAKTADAERRDDPGAVRQAQRLLRALGYYSGPITGVNGPLSTAAIREFQAIQGLPETGEVTSSLLVALRVAL